MKLFKKSVIGLGSPLMIRYVLFRCAAFGIYVHHFLRSDYDRALHDHPWPYVALILKGGYWEEHDQTLDGAKTRVWYGPRRVLVRQAEWRHRVILPDGQTSWSVVLVGRRQRRWGFWLPTGWCWWRQHNPYANLCEEEPVWHGGED